MSQCQPFGAEGPAGVADALQKVDCLASDATSVSFGRLFGAHGSFATALTIILTLYVALLAFTLLTGRSALQHLGADAADDDARPGADLRHLLDRLSVGRLEPRDRRAGRDRQRPRRHRRVRRRRCSPSSSTASSTRSPMRPATAQPNPAAPLRTRQRLPLRRA